MESTRGSIVILSSLEDSFSALVKTLKTFDASLQSSAPEEIYRSSFNFCKQAKKELRSAIVNADKMVRECAERSDELIPKSELEALQKEISDSQQIWEADRFKLEKQLIEASESVRVLELEKDSFLSEIVCLRSSLNATAADSLALKKELESKYDENSALRDSLASERSRGELLNLEISTLQKEITEIKIANDQVTASDICYQLLLAETQMEEERLGFREQISGLQAELSAEQAKLAELTDIKLGSVTGMTVIENPLDSEELDEARRQVIDLSSELDRAMSLLSGIKSLFNRRSAVVDELNSLGST